MRKTATKIPFTIAPKKKRMMSVAAKYADTWESSYVTPKQFSNLYAEFSEIWKYVNMNNNKIELTKSIESDVLIAESHSELEYKKRYLLWREVLHYIIRFLNMVWAGKAIL
jgi:hypothetical protein